MANIDPEFLREIELSLISMADYADTYLEELTDHGRASAKHVENDIKLANEILAKISKWFDEN